MGKVLLLLRFVVSIEGGLEGVFVGLECGVDGFTGFLGREEVAKFELG